MPVWLIYVLIIAAVAATAGLAFEVGRGMASILTIIGLLVVLSVLWEPLIKPRIEKWSKK